MIHCRGITGVHPEPAAPVQLGYWGIVSGGHTLKNSLSKTTRTARPYIHLLLLFLAWELTCAVCPARSFAQPPSLTVQDHRITEITGDGNALPGPGEELEVHITLQNHSSTGANGIVAVLRSAHYQVEVLYATLEVGNLASGPHRLTETFRIRIAPDYIPGTSLNVVLHLSDRDGNTWVERLDLHPNGRASQELRTNDFVNDGRVDLINWKYHPGDDSTWANPTYDDIYWHTVDTALNPGTDPTRWTGIGWFRLGVTIDTTLQHRPLALYMDQNGASEIYIDGQKTHTFGTVGTTQANEKPYRVLNPRVLTFSPKTDHLIAVRYSNFTPEALSRTADAGFIIELSDLEADLMARTVDVRAHTLFHTLLTAIPLSFAALHFLLFLFYTRYRENLYYALLAAAFACTAFTLWGSTNTTDPTNATQLIQLSNILALLTVLVGLRFVYAIFYPTLPRQFWVLLAAWAFLPIESLLFQRFRYALVALLFLLTALEMMRVVISNIRNNQGGARIFATGILGIGLSLVLILVLESAGILSTQQESYAQAFSGILLIGGPIGLMSIYLAHGLGKTNRNLEARIVEVQNLSEKALAQERQLREEAVQIRLLENELQTAHELQMGLMPTAPPQIQGLDIAGRCVPASQVGGDLFHYFHTGDRLLLTLSDATGHAMKAAIPAVMFSGILNSEMQRSPAIGTLYTHLNQTLSSTLDDQNFICFAAADITISNRQLQISNSGCPYPCHFRAATRDLVELQTDAYPLGIRPDTDYPVLNVQLQSGDCIILYSDGIPEADNAHMQQLGYERTHDVLRRACLDGLPAQATIDHILKEVAQFKGDVPQSDDMTCVMIRIEA